MGRRCMKLQKPPRVHSLGKGWTDGWTKPLSITASQHTGVWELQVPIPAPRYHTPSHTAGSMTPESR